MTEQRSEYSCETSSPAETQSLGEAVGRSLVGGLVIGLIGPLGAGKTELVKGIVAGNAGSDSVVTSPTFTLVHEYAGGLHLYHVDVYRLGDAPDLVALGFDEWLDPAAVVVIEWADRVARTIGDAALWVRLSPTGETSRTFSFEANGPEAVECLKRLRAASR